MSLDALAWARAQRVGSPPAKHLLCMIAAYADEKGKCWPSRKRLSDDTEYSVDTIDRRLRDLEDLGFIRREVPNGRKDAVKIIFLLFDVERADAELAANRTGKAKRSTQQTPETGGPQDAAPPLPQDAAPPEPHPAQGGPQSYAAPGGRNCAAQEESLSEESLKVTSSSSVPARNTEEEEGNSRIDSEFTELIGAYPTSDAMDLVEAKAQFRKLNVKDRELAIRMARRYREAVRSGGRTKALFLETWLRKGNFRAMAELAQAKAEAMGKPRPDTFVKRGTDGWNAWKVYKAKQKGRNIEGLSVDSLPEPAPVVNSPEHGGTGFWFPSLFPPAF